MSQAASDLILSEIINSVLDSYTVLGPGTATSLTLDSAIQTQDLAILDIANFEGVELRHVKVVKQHQGGLCGYHALYNIIETVNYLRLKNATRPWKIADIPSFWKFHFRTTDSLLRISVNYSSFKMWSYREVRFGDLERDFLKALIRQDSFFSNQFETSASFVPQLFTIGYQFGNIIENTRYLEEIQTAIEACIASDKEHVICFMLGITNHWVSFIAHKCAGGFEFYYFDSRNVPYLQYDEAQIEAYLNKNDRIRRRKGQPFMTKFQRMVGSQFVRDLQNLLKLLMGCFLGTNSLNQAMVVHKFTELKQLFEMAPGTDLERLQFVLDTGAPPMHIYDDFVRGLLNIPRKRLSRDLKKQLKMWIQEMTKTLQSSRKRTWETTFFEKHIVNVIANYLRG
mmetsp:Transcript_9814/g.19317  ORF Transcript_9814/g.19317 Transcript_9814/m.19317 type:complete len:397 (-) Transcript_9814:912-2102(-)